MATGQLTGISGFRAPSASIGDDALNANDPAGITKTHHLINKSTGFGFLIGDTPTTKEVPVHTCKVAGTIRNFGALLKDTGSSTSITFDLKKYNAGNTSGVSVLSSAVSVTHGTTDRALTAGTISSATTAVGDLITILMTVSSSTGALGPYAELEIDEIAT